MGAGNVLRAYARYAGKVPGLSMVCLTYMAVVSKDADTHPWFGMGHEALAEHALGRKPPITRADIKAVERAVAPLLQVGAIVTDRRAAPRSDGHKTVRYRLNLRIGTSDVPRKSGDERPPETGQDVPHFPDQRPPESGQSSPGNRGTEEYEETGGKQEEEMADLHHQRAGVARASAETRDTDQQGDGKPTPDPGGLVAQVVLAVGATPDEARALIADVERKHRPGNASSYLRTMTASGDLSRLLAELRATATPTTGPPRIDDYRASLAAACADHGTPGGASVCALCRRGIRALAREAV